MRSGVKKTTEADVQGHCLIEDALAQQTEIKDEIKAVHRHHNEGEGEFQSWSVVSKSNWCPCDQFAEEKQQKLEEKAVENQTEDEVETSMKQWSRRITEQGSDGEDVSQVDQQHQAIIESKTMAANQQKERTIHIGESDRWVDSRS